ncbi:hypothetical protein H8356DRAFT_1280291 [Neocallimastix lanati (nom. inval.)]|nr:hypothetical protein H8356DRAFT_1280291 [Neocallimastix sp. JGI-2020a]
MDTLKEHLHYIGIPYYINGNPESIDDKKYNNIKLALTSNPIKNCNGFQVENIKLPEYLKKPIPLLGRYMNIAITLNKLQVISLFANQFLCIFTNENSKLYDTPYCSFLSLLSTDDSPANNSVEKIRCVIHYFDRMRKKELHNLKTELITFQRVSLDEQSIPDWENTSVKLCNIIIDKEKFIEDCENMIQVDFANSYIGDGVLTLGCVQEEIRFAINPELLVSLNFTQRLDPLESVYIIGVERVSKYKGYGYTFQYDGDYDDSSIAFDKWNRKSTEIVALDAGYYSSSYKKYIQFSEKETKREMNKLYAGFKENEFSILKKGSYIATGNWGCGVFNGDIELKSLLQIIVASHVEKNIYYCSFGNIKIINGLSELISNLRKHNITTDILYKLIKAYNNEVIFEKVNKDSPPKITLFNYIMEKIKIVKI